jgi:DNA polymerase III sliding clamp (beta) subunit (PCNA family)
MNLHVNTRELLKTLQNTLYFQSTNHKENRFFSNFSITKEGIFIESISSEFRYIGKICSTGEYREINFKINISYLVDFLMTVESEVVELSFLKNILIIKDRNRVFKEALHESKKEIFKKENKDKNKKIKLRTLQLMNRLSFSIDKKCLTMVLELISVRRIHNSKYEARATNGFILSKIEIEEEGFDLEELLISKFALQCLLKTFSNESKINFSDDGSYYCFSSEFDELKIRKVEVEYINLNNIIPKKYESSFKIKKDELILFLNSIVKLKNDITPVVSMVAKGSYITLKNHNSLDVELKQSIRIDTQVNFEAHFNGRYLLDIVKNSKCEELKFSLNNTLSPFSISEVSKDEVCESILLPMRA